MITLDTLKRRASILGKEFERLKINSKTSHTTSLKLVAISAGYTNWSDLLNSLDFKIRKKGEKEEYFINPDDIAFDYRRLSYTINIEECLAKRALEKIYFKRSFRQKSLLNKENIKEWLTSKYWNKCFNSSTTNVYMRKGYITFYSSDNYVYTGKGIQVCAVDTNKIDLVPLEFNLIISAIEDVCPIAIQFQEIFLYMANSSNSNDGTLEKIFGREFVTESELINKRTLEYLEGNRLLEKGFNDSHPSKYSEVYVKNKDLLKKESIYEHIFGPKR